MKQLYFLLLLNFLVQNVKSQETWLEFTVPDINSRIYEIITTDDSIYCLMNDGFIITWDKMSMNRKVDSLYTNNCQNFDIDSDNNFWIGTYADGLLKYDGHEVVKYKTTDGLPSNTIWNVKISPTGDLWLGGVGGLSLFENDTCTITYTKADGLEETEIYDIEYSPDSILFVGTENGGINYFDEGKWKTFRSADGAPRRIFSFRNNVLWYTNQSAGVSTLSYLTCTAPLTIKVLPSEYDWSYGIPLLVDDNNDIWLTRKGGCSVFNPFTEQAKYSTEVGFVDGEYSQLAKDTEGNIYFGTLSKLIVKVKNPLVADFTAIPTEGSESLEVKFTNLSTGTLSSYMWNFGDGTTSNEENPVHLYNDLGSYTVSLTIGGEFGLTDQETKTDYITVSVPAPGADFSANVTSGDIDLSVTFTDNSTGDITNWSWDFGDEGTSIEQNPSHTYTEAGTYTVSLTATGAGGSDTETKTDYITVTTQTDISDLETDKNAIIYPNPAEAICSIKIPDNISGNVNIRIFNLNGEELISKNNVKDKLFNMNLSELKAGLYYISIISNNNILTDKLIIVE